MVCRLLALGGITPCDKDLDRRFSVGLQTQVIQFLIIRSCQVAEDAGK